MIVQTYSRYNINLLFSIILTAFLLVQVFTTCFTPQFSLPLTDVNPATKKNISKPSGIIHQEPRLEKKGELVFEYAAIKSEDILIGDSPASIFLSKDEIDKGLIYLRITGADESKLRVILVHKDLDIGRENMRPYGEGYYPLINGSGEYECIVLARQWDGLYSEVFKTTFDAEFDTNEPYKYSNVFSMYTDNSILAQKAYALTYKLETNDEKAKRIRDYLERNFRYSFNSDGTIELVDNDYYFDKGEGLCYHYASLFSSMMKSIGIPTREVRGVAYNDNQKHHAWNEYLNEEGEWVQIDATGAMMKPEAEYRKTEFSER